MTRPELPKLKVGDEVIVVETRRRVETRSAARVTKVARIWVDMEATTPEEIRGFRGDLIGTRSKKFRMRIDTQYDGERMDRFLTQEQADYDDRVKAARDTMKTHHVDAWPGPWHNGDMAILLAEFLDQNAPEKEES